jgi:Uma2 family endonuclease
MEWGESAMTSPVKPSVVFGTLGPTNAGLRMTVEEFLSHDDWERGPRYELIAGVLVVSPATSPEERYPNQRLATWLERYQLEHPSGKCVDATINEGDIATSTGIRRFDRAIYVGLGRLPQEPDDIPAIIIEFVSEGKRNAERDYFCKCEEYLEAGVKEYWVIDRFDRTMSVFTGAPDSPHQKVVQAYETYQSVLLPGFVLSLKELFDIADRHSKKKN